MSRQGFGIKRGDEVVVVAGEDKGRRGEVLRVLRPEGKIVIQGVNVVTRHRRGGRRTSVQQMQAGRIEMPAPVDLSNVKLICPRCDRPTKVTYARGGAAPGTRVCKQCSETLEDA